MGRNPSKTIQHPHPEPPRPPSPSPYIYHPEKTYVTVVAYLLSTLFSPYSPLAILLVDFTFTPSSVQYEAMSHSATHYLYIACSSSLQQAAKLRHCVGRGVHQSYTLTAICVYAAALHNTPVSLSEVHLLTVDYIVTTSREGR